MNATCFFKWMEHENVVQKVEANDELETHCWQIQLALFCHSPIKDREYVYNYNNKSVTGDSWQNGNNFYTACITWRSYVGVAFCKCQFTYRFQSIFTNNNFAGHVSAAGWDDCSWTCHANWDLTLYRDAAIILHLIHPRLCLTGNVQPSRSIYFWFTFKVFYGVYSYTLTLIVLFVAATNRTLLHGLRLS